MTSNWYFGAILIIFMVCNTAISIPLNGSYLSQKKQATSTGYRSLFPPKWPYTPPMKPTRPYTIEESDLRDIQHRPSHNSKLDDSSLPQIGTSGLDEQKSMANQISVNAVPQNQDTQMFTYMQYEEEKEKEKDEFIHFLRSLLWDAEDNYIDDTAEKGRQFNPNYAQLGGYGNNLRLQQQQNLLRWHGMLGRPMPQVLKRKGLAAQAYRGFEEGCYALACTFGINRLISQIGRMLG